MIFSRRSLTFSVSYIFICLLLIFPTAIALIDAGLARANPAVKSTSTEIAPKVIYGSDDRKDLYYIRDSNLLRLASASVALIYKEHIRNIDNTYSQLSSYTYRDAYKLCPTEPFLNQPTAAFCSGILVRPNVVLTAGHCVENLKTCNQTKFVFDYSIKSFDDQSEVIENSNIFSCKSILAHSNTLELDHALIELDRPVTNRHPVTWRKNGKLSLEDKLVMIGHPSGLPQKITSNGKIRSISENVFLTTLDAFYNNSGSPVFNLKTYELEGILVRGNSADYVTSPGMKCKVAKRCAEDACDGEEVEMISELLENYL